MKHKQIVIIALIACVCAVAAIIAARRASVGASGAAGASPSASSATKLYPDLGARLGDVASIVVEQGQKRAEIRRGSSGMPWVVASRDGYPAQEELARTLIRALADAEIIEKKTATPEFFSRIGVEDVTSDGAKSFLVSVRDRDGATLASVILGNKFEAANWDFSKTGTFVRPAGQNQSYLVRGTFNPQADATSWLDKSLLDMDPGSLRRVVLQHPPIGAGDAPTVTIERASRAQSMPTLVRMPEGRELSDPSAHQRVLHSIATLTLEDVKKSEGFDLAGAVVGTWTTFDGLVITTACVRKDDAYWATLDAMYQPEAALPRDESDAKPSKDEGEAIARRAEELRAKFQGWVYKLTDYTGRSFVASLESLLKPLTTTQPSEPESPVGVPFMHPQEPQEPQEPSGEAPNPSSGGG